MEEIEIKHVSDYIRYIENMSDGYRLSHVILYRGENKTGYSLIPSVYRRTTVGAYNTCTYLSSDSERSLIQSFMANAASYDKTPALDDRFSWIEYAQHFGVPTRLLDWTSNPLIALYFACYPGNEEDGKVYFLHPSFLNQLIAKRDDNQITGKTIREEVVKMVWNESKGEGITYPMVFKPYHIDQRMRAQSSWFVAWGTRVEPLDKMIEELEKDGKGHDLYRSWLADGISSIGEQEDTALSQVIIPGKIKKDLLHELDRLGINQATVFPGLDGVGKAIEWRSNASNREDFDFF